MHKKAKSLLLACSALSGSAVLLPVLMLAALSAQNQAQAGVVSGQVTDRASGAAVGGAVLSLGGHTVVSGRDGRYAFPDLPAGTYDLSVRVGDGAPVRQPVEIPAQGDARSDVVLAGVAASGVGEVVVTGQKERDRSIVDQMAATGTVSVLTAEAMKRNPDTNVAEALARLPGVAVATNATSGSPSQGNHNGVDAAGRGQGEFVSLRGMDPEYNVNLINGANVAEGMPYGRQVELSLLPPFGMDKVVVSKTSTPDMDGDAVGGTFDFRTHSAFDFDAPLLQVYAQGTLSGRALDYGLDAGGGIGQVEVADRFGPDKRFGAYVTAYYGKRNFVSSMQDYQVGQWEFLQTTSEQGASAPGVDKANNLLLTSLNAQFTRGTQERYGGNLSLDWQGDATSLHLRTTYAKSDIRQEVYQKGLQADGYSAATQLSNGLYINAESDADEHYWFETAPEVSELMTSQLGGTTRLDHLTLDYDVFYSWGQNSAPDHAEFAYQTGGLGSPFLLTYNSAGYPIPVLTAAQRAYFNNTANYTAIDGSGEFTESYSEQRKLGAHLDATYQMGDGLLDYIKAGAKMVDSHRFAYSRDYSDLQPYPAGSSLASNPYIQDGQLSSIIPGIYDYTVPLGDGDGLSAALKKLAYQRTLSADDYNGNTLRGGEAVYAAYIMAGIKRDGWEVIPGLRFEHTRINNTYWNTASGDGQVSSWQSNSTVYNEALPSLHVNYRPDDGGVYRAAIWTSYMRPALYQLGGGSQTSLNSDGSISITQGNPNLKPTESVNYDLSGEWVLDTGTHLMAGAFYKALSHYLYDRGTDYHASAVAQTGVSSISQPVNGGSGHVYGIELTANQELRTLAPGALDGFSLGGNLTLQQAAVHLNSSGIEDTSPMQGTPNVLFNASLSYDRGGFDTTLSYRYSGDSLVRYRFGTFGGNALNEWLRATQRLDLSTGYTFANGLQVGFAVQNLLDDYSYYRTIGRTADAIPEIVEPGRSYMFNATYTY
ncbi:TonB-dependent receptor [Nitrospirillum sp. BR 11828]|uniref:TonB-dependent receptor n=1 Tax=Nitrospirillum sp. BR 11828 TaxID=3104325 RepID=UPI002ACA1C21|nr:TonB-dependent receptor [Nitrospirillum sp. BR 11828]MDZ5647717.1 TonB-dependent receptor [Nitrospirillum sp. BR 11828]